MIIKLYNINLISRDQFVSLQSIHLLITLLDLFEEEKIKAKQCKDIEGIYSQLYFLDQSMLITGESGNGKTGEQQESHHLLYHPGYLGEGGKKKKDEPEAEKKAHLEDPI